MRYCRSILKCPSVTITERILQQQFYKSSTVLRLICSDIFKKNCKNKDFYMTKIIRRRGSSWWAKYRLALQFNDGMMKKEVSVVYDKRKDNKRVTNVNHNLYEVEDD